MKKFFAIICILIVSVVTSVVADASPNISSKNAILIDLKNGDTVFSVNADEKIKIASMTKIMTCILAVENTEEFDVPFTIDSSLLPPEKEAHIVEADLSSAGFACGDTVTVRDLIYGLMLPSGAECAEILANLTAGDTDSFVKLMNLKATEIGLSSTCFTNADGEDNTYNYSTVNDVALMFSYGLKNDFFKSVVSSREYITSSGMKLESTISLKQRTTGKNYDCISGGKTGTTSEAGLCLASYAEKNGEELMLVTAGAPFDYGSAVNLEDAQTVYEYYFDNYDYVYVFSKGQNIASVKTKDLSEENMICTAEESVEKFLPQDARIDYVYSGCHTVDNSFHKGDHIGTVSVVCDGKTICKTDAVLKDEPHFSLFRWIENRKKIVLLVFAFAAVLFVGVQYIVRYLVRKKGKS